MIVEQLEVYSSAGLLTGFTSQNPPSYLNVSSFGAVGDGVTNDTVAIQNAIDSGIGTLYFPAGTYIFDTLVPISNQTWVGDGPELSVLSWAQVNRTNPNIRGVQSSGNLSNVTFQNLGFRGNLLVQTTLDPTGQYLNCFWFRSGSMTNITWNNCHIFQWGGKGGFFGASGGGGIFLGSGGTGTSNVNQDIIIKNSVIEDNGNVPGVYISADPTHMVSSDNIQIFNNKFSNNTPYAFQNMIYVVGTASLSHTNVSVKNNIFEVKQGIDTVYELNYCTGFQTQGNTVSVSGSASCVGILLRSNCYQGVIQSNTLINTGTGCTDTTGISMFQQEIGEYQQDVIVSGNTVQGWGLNAIEVSNQSQNITVSENIISSSALVTTTNGVEIAGSTNVKICNNTMINVLTPVQLGTGQGGIRFCEIYGNLMTGCGAINGAMIDVPLVGQDIQGLVVHDNLVTDHQIDMTGFISSPYLADTGNFVYNNTLPAGFGVANVSYIQYIQVLSTPAYSNGSVVTSNRYTFTQGEIAMVPYTPSIDWTNPDVQLSSYVIGANLDGQLPTCNPGDQILVSCDQSFSYCNVTGYVLSTNKIRIVVTNPTTLDVSIPAANWYVTVISKGF